LEEGADERSRTLAGEAWHRRVTIMPGPGECDGGFARSTRPFGRAARMSKDHMSKHDASITWAYVSCMKSANHKGFDDFRHILEHAFGHAVHAPEA
jgi:hypothetical protein